jgi:branched-chain amino acid transport system permease protein
MSAAIPRSGTRASQLRGPAALALFLALALVFPSVEGSDYSVNLGTLILTYAAFAQTLNLVYGYLGYMSIAQVTFWGVGAYAAVKLSLSWGWNPWLATVGGGLFAALVAIPFGLLAMRRSRHAFAVIGIVTMLFAAQVANDWNGFTGGASGIVDLPAMSIPSWGVTVVSQTQFYYATLVVAAVALCVIYLLVTSRWGRLLKAIKADEELSASYGTNTTFHKVLALAIGAFFAGTLGAVTAFRVSVIDPSLINMYYVAPILAIVLIGGGGSYFGELIAGVVLTWIPEELRLADQFRDLFYGAALMTVALLLPEGVAPTLLRVVRRRGRQRVTAGQAAQPPARHLHGSLSDEDAGSRDGRVPSEPAAVFGLEGPGS